MSGTISSALELMKIAGTMACASGRARDDCPYDPIYFPEPYHAWMAGWDEAHMLMRTEPVGG